MRVHINITQIQQLFVEFTTSFFVREDMVVAAASLMFDPAVARLAEMMAIGQRITKTQAL